MTTEITYKGFIIKRTSTTFERNGRTLGNLHTIERADRYASPADVTLSGPARLTSVAACKRYINEMSE